jgi:hypothetical protein
MREPLEFTMHSATAPGTHCYGVCELVFTSARDYANALAEAEVTVSFLAPSGRELVIDAFWDGGRRWCVRFSPDEVGTWTWRSASVTDDSGLHDQHGSVMCTAYVGDHPLYRHGPLQLSRDRRSLCHADGTPFFWLADTAWNGVIRSDDANWQRYVDLRAKQAFTAIQFVATHWRGDALDEMGEASCTEVAPSAINPGYFQRIDRRVAMINEAGLIASPVGLWALLTTDIGRVLSDSDAIRVLRYVVARYGAYQVLWLMGGDGRYMEEGAARWRHIGREVFRHQRTRLVALHPCGQSWIGEAFRDEPWFDVIGYQSGHGDGDSHLRWLVQGPPASEWRNAPNLPVINLEPNYEGAYGYHQQTPFDAHLVRRASWWSCLISPTAGVTYGHDVIWNWNLVAGPSEGHGGWGHGCIAPWHTALETPGIDSMTALHRILAGFEWWRLLPAPRLLRSQPGENDPSRFVAVSRIGDSGPALVYTPVAQALALVIEHFTTATWIEPATGNRQETALQNQMTPPSTGDWLLMLA